MNIKVSRLEWAGIIPLLTIVISGIIVPIHYIAEVSTIILYFLIGVLFIKILFQKVGANFRIRQGMYNLFVKGPSPILDTGTYILIYFFVVIILFIGIFPLTKNCIVLYLQSLGIANNIFLLIFAFYLFVFYTCKIELQRRRDFPLTRISLAVILLDIFIWFIYNFVIAQYLVV